jgi:hypothetical protein
VCEREREGGGREGERVKISDEFLKICGFQLESKKIISVEIFVSINLGHYVLK